MLCRTFLILKDDAPLRSQHRTMDFYIMAAAFLGGTLFFCVALQYAQSWRGLIWTEMT